MNKLLERYKRDLTLRGYSEPTYKNYLLCIKQFLAYHDQPIEKLDCETIKDYLYYLLTEKKASDSKVRQVYSAMKYFYTQTLSRSWEEMKIPQLRKKKKLPSYFSFNNVLVHWARRKYKKLNRHRRRAEHWLGRVARREPNLFTHWEMGILPSAG